MLPVFVVIYIHPPHLSFYTYALLLNFRWYPRTRPTMRSGCYKETKEGCWRLSQGNSSSLLVQVGDLPSLDACYVPSQYALLLSTFIIDTLSTSSPSCIYLRIPPPTSHLSTAPSRFLCSGEAQGSDERDAQTLLSLQEIQHDDVRASSETCSSR